MRIEDDLKLDFDDVLMRPKRSAVPSRSKIKLIRSYTFNNGQIWAGIPIIAANMDSVGSMNMAKCLAKFKMMTALHKHYSVEELYEFFLKNQWLDIRDYTFYSMGINDGDIEKLETVKAKIENQISYSFPKFICIDVANGYTEYFLSRVKEIRSICPDSVIMAGNIVTNEMTEELILSGVQIVKAGIGGGAVCTTRIMTGCGYPQLSSVIETADAAHGLKGHVCSDGGCRNPGDVAKAFGAGADFVMLGGMFSGTDQCEGDWQEINGKKYFKFHGMSSKQAQEKHNGGLANYRAAEGKEVLIPHRGNVENVVQAILGGLKSACTYTGAEELRHLSKCCTFVRVNNTHNKIFGDSTDKII